MTRSCSIKPLSAAWRRTTTAPWDRAELAPHVFECFAEDADWTEHGLGLAIFFDLVEAFRGLDWIDSRPGRGAKVTCTLPVT